MLVLSSLPGRVRFRSLKIYKNKVLANLVKIYIENLYGVIYSEVSAITGSILIVYDEEKVTEKLIFYNIKSAIKSVLNSKDNIQGRYEGYFKVVEERDRAKRKFLIYGAIYIALRFKYSIFGKFSLSKNIKLIQLASTIAIIGGYPLLKSLYKQLSKGFPWDYDFLLNLMAVTLTLMKESENGIIVMILKNLNDYIRLASEVKCRSALNKSMNQTSGMARIKNNLGQETLVPIEQVMIKDTIIIASGEVIPVDGVVTDGEGIINTLYYMGELNVSHIKEGEIVNEGAVLLSGTLNVKVMKIPDSITKEDISIDKLNIYKRVVKIQDLMTPISIAAAALNYIFSGSLIKAFTTILVMCPSSSRLALIVGLRNYTSLLGKYKIYLRNSNTFENIMYTKSIVFDKTGTLTYGKMKIMNVISLSQHYSREEILAICTACEGDNYHPIARAFREYQRSSFNRETIEPSIIVPSKGIKGLYKGQSVLIGSKEFLQENGINIQRSIELYKDFERRLYTPILVSVDYSLCGIIGMSDILREDSVQLINGLKHKGFNDISILTGDSKEKAEFLAGELGIHNTYSRCSYADKEKIIETKKEFNKVMMVGDGVNDIPAMKAADVSVSFVNSFCDRMKVHSDCIILEDDLTKLEQLFTLSNKAYRMINRDITIAKLYNIWFGVLSILGNIDIFTAESINTMSSIIILIMSERIRWSLQAPSVYREEE